MPSWDNIFESLGTKKLQLVQMSSKEAPLAFSFEVDPDSCGNPDYFSQYIRLCAITDHKCGISTTHLLIDTEQQKIISFLSLRATSLLIPDDNTPKISIGHPALEIYQLAVDKKYAHENYGTFMAFYAIYIAEQTLKSYMGIEYVVLCADEKAVSFYSKDELKFCELREYYTVPRDGSNSSCTPMFLKLNK